jgi:2-octaprenyl-6-methoxyphenol hydroxylase
MIGNCDIAIIGGGPVGAALALALRDSGLRITVLEARKPAEASTDPRALALSYGSRLLLSQLGVWQELSQISAIQTIHISQQNSFGRTLLKAADLKVPDLGYVLPYAALQTALQIALQNSSVNYLQGAAVTNLDTHSTSPNISFLQDGIEKHLNPRLVVVADGGKLLEAIYPPEIHDYGQSALIAHVTCTQPLLHTAFERFTPQGPLALFPIRTDMSWYGQQPMQPSAPCCNGMTRPCSLNFINISVTGSAIFSAWAYAALSRSA